MDKTTQLAYISTQTQLLPTDEIHDILKKSIKNNRSKGISGMLLFYNGTFLQVLEGNEKQILDLYEFLKLDKRHKNLKMLYKKDINKPEFSSWSMGFVDVAEIIKSNDKDFITYFNDTNLTQSGEPSNDLIGKVKVLIDKFQNGAWRYYIK